ncbi:alpha/beta-hydrolase [Xylariales sp. PMI_506]|nr:alpha/beta-hydrolase [Xylariales sp. PMI_506]
MDAVFAKILEKTVTFNLGDDVMWRETYEPLYPEVPKEVKVIKDAVYGPAERNRLDVYVPEGGETGKPVMMYIHGGGFFSGDKAWSEKCYANIGYFFAQKGIVTVLINHQLVPDVQYPGGAEDIQLAREWIYKNISAQEYGSGSPSKVFLFGHSSGGAHVMMNLCAAGDPSRVQRDPLFPPIAGAMILDVPFWFDRRKPVRQKTLRSYYGSDNEAIWGPKSVLGLFERLPEDSPVLDSRKLPLYIGTVEWEVPETADATVMFLNAYRSRSKPEHTLPTFHVLKNHNHISNVLSIGTEDTAQARHILEFIDDCLKHPLGVKL